MQIEITGKALKTDSLAAVAKFIEKFIREKENIQQKFSCGESNLAIFPFFDYQLEEEESDSRKLAYFNKAFVPVTAQYVFDTVDQTERRKIGLHKILSNTRLPNASGDYPSSSNISAVFGDSLVAVQADDPSSGWRAWRDNNFVMILASTDRVFEAEAELIPLEDE